MHRLRRQSDSDMSAGEMFWCSFWATVCKTVRPMLLDHCPVSLSVCDVGVLWPDGWMDQDETWHEGRPRPWQHSVRWGPNSPPRSGHSPQFSAHTCCGQMAGWINVPLGRELGLCPSDIVLDGDPAHPSPKRRQIPPNFWPMYVMAKRLDGSRWHLVWR